MRTAKKYGTINGGCSKQALEKIKNTCLKKYGVESTWKIKGIKEKSKETKIKKYNNPNFVNPQKIKQTKLERYGDENYNNIEKYKQTCIERYNVDHNWKIPGEHDLTHTPEALEKKKQTSLKNWGVEHPHQCKEIINKVNNTKKINHIFNTSKYENQSYQLLKEKYSDIKYQYISKLYPYCCDFYIPSLDLYIECNYHWTHGSKPFENSKEDNIKLEKWKNKHTKFYNNAIECWTKRDVNKRNIAKQNNLNYIEFWNITELKEWLKNK